MDIFQLCNCMHEHFQEEENVVTAIISYILVNFGTRAILVYSDQSVLNKFAVDCVRFARQSDSWLTLQLLICAT